MKIMVVDDSVVFRTQISQALKVIEGIEVSCVAANGRIAIQKLSQQPIDLITLDMEMPEMNGLETLKEIRQTNTSIKIIVYSSQTLKGAEKALLALREGADDVIAKPSGSHLNFDTALEAIRASLVPKILQFTDQRLNSLSNLNQFKITADQEFSTKKVVNTNEYFIKNSIDSMNFNVVLIASSTGGPTALESIFSKIPGPYKVPVLIVQHMPPVFTQILARRLSELTKVKGIEVTNGDFIDSNYIYVARGDHHFKVIKVNDQVMARTTQDELRNSIRPAADYLFETAVNIYGPHCLGIVLTGMGEDGCDGAKAIKRKKGGVIIQDKDSCTVFGMPGAVFEAGAFDEIGNIDFIIEKLTKVLKG